MSPIDVPCPHCGATPSNRCKTGHYGATLPPGKHHKARVQLAEADGDARKEGSA